MVHQLVELNIDRKTVLVDQRRWLELLNWSGFYTEKKFYTSHEQQQWAVLTSLNGCKNNKTTLYGLCLRFSKCVFN